MRIHVWHQYRHVLHATSPQCDRGICKGQGGLTETTVTRKRGAVVWGSRGGWAAVTGGAGAVMDVEEADVERCSPRGCGGGGTIFFNFFHGADVLL